MTSNTKVMVLRTQAPERKGSHKPLPEKNRLAAALKYTYSSGEMKYVKVNILALVQKSSHRIWVGTAETSRLVPVTTYRNPSLCYMMTFWCENVVLACIRYVYDFQNPNEAVYFPPLSTDSNLREASDVGLYHSAPYWQNNSLITAPRVEGWQVTCE